MKIIPALLVFTLMGPGVALAQVSPCGNADPGGPGGQGGSTPSPKPSPSPTPGPCDPDRPNAASGDPVLPYTGNEFKRVDDLQISGSPGQLGMLWSRHSNSRAVAGASLFGLAHYWRHSFQWELAPISNDTTGRRRMELIYPDGARFRFLEVAPGDFQPLAALTDKLAERPDGFWLERKDGSQRIFKKRGTVAAPFYLMEEMRDPVGNAYLLEYNAARQVTKITEPGGRFFRVDYRTLTGNRLNPSTLAALRAAPAPGQWVEMPITNQGAFRFVRLVQADKSFGQIAEVEFYEAGTGLKLDGQIICSDSAAAGQAALDGSASTSFVSSSQSGGFVGFDLGSPRKIGRVRFLSTTGKEAVHKPSGWNLAAVRIEGANQAPITTQAIASVQTDDGRPSPTAGKRPGFTTPRCPPVPPSPAPWMPTTTPPTTPTTQEATWPPSAIPSAAPPPTLGPPKDNCCIRPIPTAPGKPGPTTPPATSPATPTPSGAPPPTPATNAIS
jgi:hypothetical protein